MLIVYGKKPRKSKSAEVYEYGEAEFFLYSAKAKTKGIVEIYHNVEPYPLIGLSESNEKAKMWIMLNLDRINDSLSIIDSYEHITRDDYDTFIKEGKKKKVETKNSSLTIEECQRIHNEFMKETSELDLQKQ